MKQFFSFRKFLIPPFDVKGSKEIEMPEGFPDCCNYHEDVYAKTKNWIENKFPRCCGYHKRMFKSPELLERVDRKGIPLKIYKNVDNTISHINKVTESKQKDWLEDIFDFVEYTIQSFGYPNAGGDQYIKILLDRLKRATEENKLEASEDEKQELKTIIEKLTPITKGKAIKHDIGGGDYTTLMNTYRRWLKLFPFVIKEKLSIPIVKSKIRTNRYSKDTIYSLVTQKELIDSLVQTTEQIIKAINLKKFIKESSPDVVKDFNQEILYKEYEVKTQKLLSEFDKGELRYVNVIGKWYRTSSNLITKVRPYIDEQNFNYQPKNYLSKIFRSYKAQEWFFNALYELNTIDENGNAIKRGFQAKASAIFKNQECKDHIFKYELQLKDYIGFLNNEYDNIIKNDTNISSGTVHEKEVKRLIELYLKD